MSDCCSKCGNTVAKAVVTIPAGETPVLDLIRTRLLTDVAAANPTFSAEQVAAHVESLILCGTRLYFSGDAALVRSSAVVGASGGQGLPVAANEVGIVHTRTDIENLILSGPATVYVELRQGC